MRDEELLPRISESWWYDIFVHRVVFDLNPNEIIDAVHHIGAGKLPSDVAVTEFKRGVDSGSMAKTIASRHATPLSVPRQRLRSSCL